MENQRRWNSVTMVDRRGWDSVEDNIQKIYTEYGVLIVDADTGEILRVES